MKENSGLSARRALRTRLSHASKVLLFLSFGERTPRRRLESRFRFRGEKLEHRLCALQLLFSECRSTLLHT